MTIIIKRRIIVTAILVLLFLQVGSNLSFGQNFPKEISRKEVNYKLADKPLYIDPVYNGSTDPTVCFNHNTNKWYMYYTNRRTNVPGLDGIESVHGSPIGIAASEDGGATWKYIGNCNIDYHPDKNPTYWAPEVIEYEGIYHMFVTFKKGSPGLWGGSPTILYTTDRSNCAINTILMRYADILLMHAEALVEGSSTSQEIY